MKKILLSLLLFSAFTNVYSQNRFSDYQDFIEKSVIATEPGFNPKVSNDFILYSENINIGTSVRDVFKGESFNRTNDNIYFLLRSNYYLMFIPELHILYTISSSVPNKNVIDHFFWLTSEIRKYKQSVLSNN